MVGKVVTRPRLHQAAPKLAKPPRGLGGEESPAEGALPWPACPAKDRAFLSSNLFAGVKIDPQTLVKTLDADLRSVISVAKGEEAKPHLSKKEKMKLRRDRWLQKIERIKVARQERKAEAKRKATPVVGDMRPLMDSLPELSDLVTVSKFGIQPKTPVKTLPTNFNRMKSAQKRRILEEEIAQFHKTVANPLFKANPMTVIGEHLSKRLKEEREGKAL